MKPQIFEIAAAKMPSSGLRLPSPILRTREGKNCRMGRVDLFPFAVIHLAFAPDKACTRGLPSSEAISALMANLPVSG